MIIVYKNTDLDIYINSKKFEYNIDKDINIDLLRAEFNNSIGMLSKNHDSLLYWLMEISEEESQELKLGFDYWDKILIRTWALLERAHETRAIAGQTVMKNKPT